MHAKRTNSSRSQTNCSTHQVLYFKSCCFRKHHFEPFLSPNPTLSGFIFQVVYITAAGNLQNHTAGFLQYVDNKRRRFPEE
jgi:Ulp1 family protease